MIKTTLDNITKETIEELIANAVPENRSLEYKEQLILGDDRDKKKFLAHIVAMSNTIGGDLVYGIVEDRDTGMPLEAAGFAVDNFDFLKQTIESVVRVGIDPRIPALGFKLIPGFAKGSVLVIRVTQSRTTPHALILKTESPFYQRSNAGKFSMDVDQIREAFISTGSIGERAKQFRLERVSAILRQETADPLVTGPVFILHVIPQFAFEVRDGVAFDDVVKKSDVLWPLYGNGYTPRINFEGVVNSCSMSGAEYVQIFPSGIIEYVSQAIVTNSDRDRGVTANVVPMGALEMRVIKAVGETIAFYRKVDITGPVYVMLTLLGVKGSFAPRNYIGFSSSRPLDREDYLLPEFRMENLDGDVANFLYPVFNTLWRAFGVPNSVYYDPTTKRRRNI